MASFDKVDVVIVGAGPGGLSAAIRLRQLAAAASTLPEMLFMIFALYGVSAYFIAAWDLLRRGKRSDAPPPGTP